MQRARRAAVVAVVALTGGLMLAGCQSQPSVAAYVGDNRITVHQVDKIVDELDATVRQHQGSIPDESYGNVRQLVLGGLVFVEVAKRYVEEQSLPAPAIDIDGVAQQEQLPASLGFVALEAQVDAYQNMLFSRAAPSAPTDADLHDVYNRAPRGTQTFEQVKAQLQSLQGLPAAVGVRNMLQKVLDNDHVVLNPQYRGTEIPIYKLQTADGTRFTAIALTLGAAGDDSDFVSSA